MPRAWRRAQRLPIVSWCVVRVRDALRARRFFRERESWEGAFEQWRNCVTSNDYLTLSNAILGAHQLSSEIVAFLDFARSKEPRRVVEIGTAMGGTNFLLSQAIPDVTLMIGVDLFVANRAILRSFSRSTQTLHFVNGSSYAAAIVARVGRLLAGQSLDLLFIDGDHTYEGARLDFARYRHFVRPGGLIAFHDIVADYQTRFGRQTGRWTGQVPILWEKVKMYYPFHEFVEDPAQDGFGIGVIEYDPDVSLPDALAK